MDTKKVKTRYRIIPVDEYDYCIQFELKEKKTYWWRFWDKSPVEISSWCYIPDKYDCYLHGKFTKKEDCPKESLVSRPFQYRTASTRRKDYLEEFIFQYPNIDDYFLEMKEKREEYLKEREEFKKEIKVYYYNDDQV